MTHLIYLLQFYAVCLLSLLAKALPLSVANWIARRIGDISYCILAERQKTALENINRAFKNTLTEARKKEIARASFQNVAVSILELFTIEKIKKDFSNRFEFNNSHYLEDEFKKGRGVVLAISHLGSWEYLSFLSHMTTRRWSVIVKDIKNPYVNGAIDALRRMTNVIPIPKLSSVRTILKELKGGNGVAILIDQWAGDEGLWIDFFGEKTSTTSIPARLAEKTDCSIVSAYCLRKGVGKYEIFVEPPFRRDMQHPDWEVTVTKKLNQVLEEKIRAYPDQWLWGHRRWKPKPDQIRDL